MLPIGSSSRRLLNQSTHSSVAYSTASSDRHGAAVAPRRSRREQSAERGVPMKPQLIECCERRYDAILAEGLAFHEAQVPLAPAAMKGGGKWRGRAPRRTGHNLLLRLATRKQDTLRFLHDPTVPFTNNQAERDGRMMKLRQKISGGFRSPEGAMNFALIPLPPSRPPRSRAGTSSTPSPATPRTWLYPYASPDPSRQPGQSLNLFMDDEK